MGHKLVTACFICTLWSFLNKNLFCKFWLCSYFVIYCRRRWWRKAQAAGGCGEGQNLGSWGRSEGRKAPCFIFWWHCLDHPTVLAFLRVTLTIAECTSSKFLLSHFSSANCIVVRARVCGLCSSGASWDERGSLVVWLLLGNVVLRSLRPPVLARRQSSLDKAHT
jgi:hypothetical protein